MYKVCNKLISTSIVIAAVIKIVHYYTFIPLWVTESFYNLFLFNIPSRIWTEHCPSLYTKETLKKDILIALSIIYVCTYMNIMCLTFKLIPHEVHHTPLVIALFCIHPEKSFNRICLLQIYNFTASMHMFTKTAIRSL